MSRRSVIVLTGGGSGGHITPILAIAAELRRAHGDDVRLIYVGQTGDKLGDIPAKDPHIDQVFTVRAGKFRRYHGEGFKQLLDLPTMAKNLRDAVFVLIGIWQSWRIIGRLKPDVVFSRGGFVSVPVALGAALNRVPYITHDSDPIPSLANRIIAPWAAIHAVALPKEIYAYPPDKTVTTGVPLQATFEPVTESLKQHYRLLIKIPKSAQLIFVIGGGQGAVGLNDAVTEALPHLMHEFPDLHVVHVAGRANEKAVNILYEGSLSPAEQGRVQVFGYLSDVYRYSGAADLVITRAGATNLAEFAVQGKACIVVPGSVLAGGHQVKNAQYLQNREAAIVIPELSLQEDPNRLAKQVDKLLKDPQQLDDLGRSLSQFAKPHATREIADLIYEQANKRAG